MPLRGYTKYSFAFQTFALTKNLSPNPLAELCGAALNLDRRPLSPER